MNIYVGNLSYKTTEDELKTAFEVCGTVTSATIIKDKFTDSSRGFGFVEMPNDEEAKKAIAELNGNDLGGKELKVNEARPREERPKRNFGRVATEVEDTSFFNFSLIFR